jgi:hypothetical protein
LQWFVKEQTGKRLTISLLGLGKDLENTSDDARLAQEVATKNP